MSEKRFRYGRDPLYPIRSTDAGPTALARGYAKVPPTWLAARVLELLRWLEEWQDCYGEEVDESARAVIRSLRGWVDSWGAR